MAGGSCTTHNDCYGDKACLGFFAARSHSLNTTGRRRGIIIMPVMTSTPTARPVAMTARFNTLLVE